MADQARSLFDDVSLDRLRARRSAKWSAYPPDVLPAFIAELDVPLAEPVAAALHAAIDAGDTGYATPGELGAAFAEFAAARLGWEGRSRPGLPRARRGGRHRRVAAAVHRRRATGW